VALRRLRTPNTEKELGMRIPGDWSIIRFLRQPLVFFQIRKTSETGRSEFSDSRLAVWWPNAALDSHHGRRHNHAAAETQSVADREVCGESVDGLAAIARTQELLVERSSA